MLRVLLIDDHEMSRVACRALLHAEGVHVVDDLSVGDAGIAVAYEHGPNIVIVDVSAADKSGFALARRLRGSPRAPLVVLTSSAEQMMFDARVDGFAFIAKADLCVDEILEAIEEQ